MRVIGRVCTTATSTFSVEGAYGWYVACCGSRKEGKGSSQERAQYRHPALFPGRAGQTTHGHGHFTAITTRRNTDAQWHCV